MIVDPDRPLPLYRQLYEHLRAAILSGELKPSLKLPSTRGLAGELNLSRNTVQNAYDQLTAEGYLERVPGSGTFVTRELPERLLTAPDPDDISEAGQPETARDEPRVSGRAAAQLALSRVSAARPPDGNRLPRPFRADTPALDAFPSKIWTRLVARQARRMAPGEFAYRDPAGYRPLREAIAAHVTVSRQVRCTPDRIVIVSGSQGDLDLTARTLLNPGDAVWMEDPGYLGARGAFVGAGARVVPVPVDAEGLVLEIGIERAPEARLAYLTPSHQFPLRMTLSLARRLEIRDWAARAGAYLILPPALVAPFLAVRRLVDVHGPVLEQAALADFITEGHFTRHLHRMRVLYADRRTALLEAAAGLPLEIDSPPAGIHCIGWLPEGIEARDFARCALEAGLELTPVTDFSIEPPGREGVLLGYGGFDEAEIRTAVRRLAEIYQTTSGTMN